VLVTSCPPRAEHHFPDSGFGASDGVGDLACFARVTISQPLRRLHCQTASDPPTQLLDDVAVLPCDAEVWSTQTPPPTVASLLALRKMKRSPGRDASRSSSICARLFPPTCASLQSSKCIRQEVVAYRCKEAPGCGGEAESLADHSQLPIETMGNRKESIGEHHACSKVLGSKPER